MIYNGRALQPVNDFPEAECEFRPDKLIIQSPSEEDKGDGTETARVCSPVRGESDQRCRSTFSEEP
jgi:hypothetical protein